MAGYVQLPEGWERVSADGAGPFVTAEVFRGPDGRELRWQSRSHRKASPARQRRTPAGSKQSVWWRPRTRSWWMAVLFCIGSACFTAAAIASQWESSSHAAIGVVFFVGSLFFTSAAYLQFSEAVNVEHGIAPGRRRSRWRPASWEPRRIDWLATLVQLIGTVLFNISTFAAMSTGLTTQQINHRVWAPDVFGSIAFLIASELAFAEVCHRWFAVVRHSLPWKVVALNLLGSVAFGASAIASLVEPATGRPVSAVLANATTSLGGICFFLGALLLMPEAAGEEQAAQSAPPVAGTPVPVSP